MVGVTEVTEFGDFKALLADAFEATSPAVARGESGRIEEAFLEVGEGPFRVLVVNEDDSAMMVGVDRVDWVREEALAAVDQVRCCCCTEWVCRDWHTIRSRSRLYGIWVCRDWHTE